MKNILICISFFLFLSWSNTGFAYSSSVKEDKPGWINYKTRENKYPKSIYVKGFSSEKYNAGSSESRRKFFGRLEGYARTQLVESIHVNIKSLTTNKILSKNTKTAHYFRQTSLSLSDINISGLKTKTYFDEDEKRGYVFTYARKEDISNLYENKLQEFQVKIAKELQYARQAKSDNNITEALEGYFKCNTLLEQAKEAQGILMSLNQLSYEAPVVRADTFRFFSDAVETGIQNIQSSGDMNLEGVSYFLAHGIAMQTKNLDKKVYFTGVSFEDTKTNSRFSKQLKSQLEKDLTKQGIKVITRIPDFASQKSRKKYYHLSGTYWEKKDQLKIILNLKDNESGETIASTEALMPKSYLKDNEISYKPANFSRISNNLDELNSNEVAGSGLNVAVTTNKGRDNPIFTKNDTLKLYVKVNKPCYVRFVYHLADGKKVLMMDNTFIDRSKVNKMYQIPELFVIAPPYGAEVLQVNAQTKAFEPLNTKPYGHYKLITDSMNDVLTNLRGFKPVKNNEGHDEAKVTLTTMDN